MTHIFAQPIPTAPVGNEAARFWAKVDKSPALGGCWLWTGALAPGGYGMFGLDGGVVRMAHRVAYAWTTGDDLIGQQLSRTCVRPNCVSPAHHRVGSKAGHHLAPIDLGARVDPCPSCGEDCYENYCFEEFCLNCGGDCDRGDCRAYLDAEATD